MIDYIYHHGIKGQRWGVRRYQNADGTLTAAGRRRLNLSNNNLKGSQKIADSSSKITNEFGKINDSVGNIKTNKKTYDLSKMSDQQLKDVVKRMNLEQQYVDLTSRQVSRGRSNVGSVLDIVGSSLAITSSAIGIALAIKEFKK